MGDSRWSWTVETPGERADKAIAEAIERGEGQWSGDSAPVSRSRVQKLMEDGAVLIDGKPCEPKQKLFPGNRIEIRIPPARPMELSPEDRPIEILFQDQHLLVINKPQGLTVHPSSTQREGTLVNALLHHVKDLSGIGGQLRPGIVHRIDKDTSGALVITKSDAAHQKLADVFARHAIERAYWALCYGAPKDLNLTIRGRIGRSPSDRKRMALLKSGGRESVSHVKQLEAYGPKGRAYASWLEVRLETGRTHQVRVHLTSLGNSIFGDPVYGTPTSKQPKWTALPQSVQEAVSALPGQALHARVLGFDHPITGEKLRFEAEPPPAFIRVVEALSQSLR